MGFKKSRHHSTHSAVLFACLTGATVYSSIVSAVTISNDPAAGDQTDARIVSDNTVNAIGQSFVATATGDISSISIVNDASTMTSCNLYLYSGQGVNVGSSLFSKSVGTIADTTNGTNYTLTSLSTSGAVGSTSVVSGSTYTFWLTQDESAPTRCLEPLLYNTSTYASGATLGDSGGGATVFSTFDMVFEVEITTNSAPTISGAPASSTVTEDVATDVNLSAVTLADSDGDNLTLTIGVGSGIVASSDGNGVFSGVTVAQSGTASMTLSGTAANINTYLDTTTKINFTTASNNTSSITLTLTPNDGSVNGTADTTTLNVTPVNDAPGLNAGVSPVLSGINEDAGDDDSSGADGDDDASNNTNNGGTTTAAMVVDGSITDPDGGAVEAVAVTHVDNTQGVWQYSLDNASSWNAFSGTIGSSVDISASARLLDGTLGGASTQLVRFVPNVNYNGSSTLTFKAWDKSSGSAGGTADTTGGSTAFSTTSDTASVAISAVNDAPMIGSLAGDSISFIQSQTAKVIDQSANASVVDIDSSDFNSGNVTVSITANKDAAEDVLSIDTSGVMALAGTTIGSNVSVSSTVIGTLGNNIATGNDLVVNLNANANAARVQSLLQSVTYQNIDAASPTLNTRTVRFTLNDGDGATSVNTESAVVVVSTDSDGDLIASAGLSEPTLISTTIDTVGEAIDVLDFTLSDGGAADGVAMNISAISVQVSGTATDAQRAKLTWRISGPDVTNVAGTYDAANDEIDFTGLSISVADSTSETYVISAYFNDNTGAPEGLTYILSVDGDTNVVTSGTSMGTTAAVNNGSGVGVEVVATALSFTTQPNTSTSGSALGTQPVVSGIDAFGNIDTGFTETITLTESSAGALTGDIDITAVSGVATFTDVVYTATADQQSFTLTANDEDGTGTNLSTVDANSVTSDVVATKLVFDTQPAPLSLESGQATNFTTVPVVSAQDANNVVDTGYATGVTLAEVNGAGSATMSATGDTDGSGSTVTITPSSGVSTFTAMQITYTASGGSDENFNLQASSGGLNTADSSQFTSGTFDSDATVTAAANIIEPVNVDSTVDALGEAVAVLDFTISDGGASDGKVTAISAIDINTSGTADASQFTYLINGPDATNVMGSYNAGTVSFSGLNVSIADGTNEVYAVSVYYNDNTGLTEGQTLVLSTDGDTDFTLAGNSTKMAATTAITNGVGSSVSVIATELRVTTQPASSTSGLALGTQPVIAATDAFGNTDTDFAETVTLTEASAGTLANATQMAVSGVATYTNVIYTATLDQQSFILTANDDDGVGTNLPTVNSNSVTSDVVATKLVFNTQPVPTSVTSGVSTLITTQPIVHAVDADNLLDTGYVTNVTFSEVNGAGSINLSATGDSDGNNATATLTPVAGVVGVVDMQVLYTALGAGETFNLRAASGGLTNVESDAFNVNMAPTLTGLPSPVTIVEDVPTNLTLNALDFDDVDNDTITATFAVDRGKLIAVDGDGVFAGVTIANANGVSGSASISFSGTSANLDTFFDSAGKLQFQTNMNDTVAATLTVTPNDGTVNGSASNATINITGINDAPSISGSPLTSVAAGQAYSFIPTANDPEGDTPLTFSITNRPSWAVFDTSTGALTGTPTNANVGTTTGIVIRVEDPSMAGNDLPSFNLTVQNPTPPTPADSAPVIGQGTTTSVTMSEDNSPVAFALTLSATDPQNDPLTWRVSSAAEKGTAAVFGSGNSIAVEYIPEGNFNGSDTFRVAVSDGNFGDSITVNVTVQPVNDAPTITGTPASSVRVGQNYTFTPVVNDVENDTLLFSVENAPSWLQLNTETGVLSGSPSQGDLAGSNIILRVSDGQESASLSAFSIELDSTNTAPTAVPISVEINEDSRVTVQLQGQDADQDELTYTIITSSQNGVLEGSGSQWVYIPNANFSGSDSFTYRAKDALSESENAIVNIEVLPINDAPIAHDDEFVFERNANQQYRLDVLDNDEDVDSSTLILEGASVDIGTVSIVEGELLYQSPQAFVGILELRYSVRDEGPLRDSAEVSLTIEGASDANVPVITPPTDIELNATGRFTRVDLGVASAVDSEGNVLPVQLIDNNNLLAPGEHLVYWSTEDAQGNQATAEQGVRIHPKVSFGSDITHVEGTQVRVEVMLNGVSPTYPVEYVYSVAGTADSNDHDLVSGSVVIDSGQSGFITFSTLEDGVSEQDETIVITLSDANLGAKSSITVQLVESNVAPTVALVVSQANENRLTVTNSGGDVSVVANTSDANTSDTVSVQWQAEGLFDLSASASSFVFSPSAVSSGIYQVTATASDDGSPMLSQSATAFIEVVNALPVLSESNDSDGDLIPDAQEGYQDVDGDGIPDYLDAISDCSVVPERVETQDGFLVEGEPGVCLRRGDVSSSSELGGILLTEEEGENRLGSDSEAQNTGGLFDFIAYGLPDSQDSYLIVLPQNQPIPENAVYRKFNAATGWFTFVENTLNTVYSAQGEQGFCPPPGDTSWAVGLIEGAWCVQLEVQDGGPNDNDGAKNGSINDPGGVAVLFSGNALPETVNDFVEMPWNSQITINVLENDTDVDGDPLNIVSALANLGQVTINADNTVTYIAPEGFSGSDQIVYVVSDDNGGTVSGQVAISIIGNRAPIAVDDVALVSNTQAMSIPVLVNDTDADGNELTIVSAVAQLGQVSISMENTLLYVAPSAFVGDDLVTYQIADTDGATSSATVTISINTNLVPQVNADAAETLVNTSITVDVLVNDTDDGNDLSVVAAVASSGSAVVNGDNRITFTPEAGFTGTVNVAYDVTDGFVTVTGQLQITVVAEGGTIDPPQPPSQRSSGGAIGIWMMSFLILLVFYRRRRIGRFATRD